MPWLAVPFKDLRIEMFKEKFEPEGIPYLMIVKNDETVIQAMLMRK